MKIRIIALVFSLLLFTPITMIAQSEVDSLKSRIPQLAEDSTKVNSFIQLSSLLIDSSVEEASNYAEEALDLATKIDYVKGMAQAFKYIGLSHYYQNQYVEATLNYQKSLKQFEKSNDQIGISNILNNMGTVYSDQGDDEKALELYLRSLRIAEDLDDKMRICTVSLNIGLIYQKKSSSLNEAKEYYTIALDIANEIEYQLGIGYASVNLGEVYLELGQDSLALVHFEQSSEALQNSVAVSYVLLNIAKVYTKQKDFFEAKKVQERALSIAEVFGNKGFMAMAFTGLALEITTQPLNRSKLQWP